MMNKELLKNQYRIPTTRLQNWDDTWNGKYFITLCSANSQNLFGEIKDQKMILSPVGILAFAFWYEIENRNKNIELDAFVVMPNHLHGIINLKNKFDRFHTTARRITDIKIEQLADDDPMKAILREVDESYPEHSQDGQLAMPMSFEKFGNPSAHQKVFPNSSLKIDHSMHGFNPATVFPSALTIRELFEEQISKYDKQQNSISGIINCYKSAVSGHAHRLGYSMDWKERSYDHLIHNNEELKRIRFYINTNPLNWGKDKFYE